MKLALIQMTSTDDMAANIAKLERFVAKAVGQGAQLVATPENTFLMEAPSHPPPNLPPQAGGGKKRYTQDEHPGVKAAAAIAARHNIWLLIGSVAVIPSPLQGEGKKTANRSLLFNPSGDIVASYDKIHLFDVEVGDGQTYKESAKIIPGGKVVVAEMGCGDVEIGGMGKKNKSPHLLISISPYPILGLSICYDVRFPQLYRALAKAGAQMISVPSAFTQMTGEAHWHVLLRARAIENGCFVIAPAQTGTHPGGRKTFGHSLVVGPWGDVIVDGGTEEGVVMAEIDLSEVEKVRAKIPSLQHDQEFSF